MTTPIPDLGSVCPLCKREKPRSQYICLDCFALVPTDQRMLWKVASPEQRQKIVHRWVATGTWHGKP